MDSVPNHIETFLCEADDLLAQIEQTALALDPAHPTDEEINHIFRAFHTIKGSGSMFGFDAVAAFTHHVESALDLVRDGKLPLSDELRELVLLSRDHIAELLAAHGDVEQVLEQDGKAILARIQSLLSESNEPVLANTQEDVDEDASQPSPSCLRRIRIRFRPSPDLMLSGTRPHALLDELRELGECEIVADASAIPPLQEIDPTLCYLAWEINLVTDRDLAAVRDVFIFVEEGSEIDIEELPFETASHKAETGDQPPTQSAPAKPAARASAAGERLSNAATLRVSSERLDLLVALVGELVINQAHIAEVATRLGDSELSSPVEEFDRLVGELRDSVLGIRMMPIGATFALFNRLVHDLSAELGKKVQLVTEGAETELDKTVLDQIGEPLVHLIRNSLDHGIEPAEARATAGKPEHGTLRLSATHAGTNVVISISDDGRGLDADALRSKAIDRGLISEDASLSDSEIYNLIFQPGFSTAQAVTNISGRGVGMDVVRRQIETLGGAMSSVLETVELSSAEHSRNNGRHTIALRGELIPYLRLRETFSITSEAPTLEKVVVVRHGNERVGLVVDRVLGSHQTVIQSLGHFYQDVEIAAGATIMGDGQVAIILDLAGIVRLGRLEAAIG